MAIEYLQQVTDMATPAQQLCDTPSNTGDTPAAGRARYHDPENFFSFKWPAVPRRQFVAERDAAFDADVATSEILLDSSEVLESAYPATTPLLLARYLCIRQGESLTVTRRASAEIFYVLRGEGSSSGCGESIEWSPGDTFCFPGGAAVTSTASSQAVLFSVCNEPLLRYESLQPASNGQHERVQPVHWPKGEMDERFKTIFARPDSEETAGRALQLSSAAMDPARYPTPTMNVAINTLQAGGDQRPHRHNGAAITLAVIGEGVHSMIEDERVDWAEGAAQVTPAAELHSHHNRGNKRMLSLVVQDEGLHFYARTPGFSWT
ncbi:MAG: gentisate 1,2-dioxygenase [Gammaproteobacteria bacterium]|jgi:gentisate 1,2-dioxygenase